MLSESVAGASQQSVGTNAFWWRLTDNLFRRLGWFLLPVVLLGVLGMAQAQRTPDLFQSSGTLSVSTNPLVPEQPVGGAAQQFWETPAEATSRLINERLRTDIFLSGVAQRAGLGDQIAAGLLDLGVVRAHVWATPNGDSILSVNAQWHDPQTSHQLADGAIAEYQAFLASQAASDYADAEALWRKRMTELEGERDAALDTLSRYVESLPALDDGEDYPIAVEVELDQLRDSVNIVESRIQQVESEIDNAQLLQTQQTSEAGRSLDVIDEPGVPGAPISTLMNRLVRVASFLVLGLLISIAALLVTTVLDHSVASVGDLLGIDGITMVATVPPVKLSDAPVQKRLRMSARRDQKRRRR